MGHRRARRLRGRQRVLARAGSPPARPGAAGHRAVVGHLGRRPRTRPGRPGADRAQRPGVHGAGAGAGGSAPGPGRRRDRAGRGRSGLGAVLPGLHRRPADAAVRRAAGGAAAHRGRRRHGRHRRRRRVRRPAAHAARGRARPPAPGTGPGRGRGRAGPRVGRRAARGPRLPRRRLRLGHRGRPAQPDLRRHRPDPARHHGVRPPDAEAAGRVPGRHDHRLGCRRAGTGRGRRGHRRARRHHRDGLPLPGWREHPGTVVGPGRGRRGRHLRLPGRPQLADRRALRPGPGRRRQDLFGAGRLPARGGRVRPGLLRHLAAGGTVHGSAAAPAAGDGVGGVRAGRDRPAHAAGQRHRHLHRGQLPGLHRGRVRRGGQRRRPHDHRLAGQHPVRPALLPVRAGGPGGHPGHRLLVVAGRHPPGRAVAAVGGEQPGAGRRGERDGDAGGVRRLLAPARTGHGRPLQGLLGPGRRHDPRRGRRPGAAGEAVRRAAQRAPDPGGGPGFGHEPGRRVQRHDRAQRPVPAAGDPAGAGQRAALGVRGGRDRGPRHRHRAGRPDRGPGPAGHLRPGPGTAAAARLGEVQHRPHPDGLRRGRRDQGGAGAAARAGTQDAARGRALHARRLEHRLDRAAVRQRAVAGERPAAPGRYLVLRAERHERAHHPRAGPGTGRRSRPRAGARPGAGPAVRPDGSSAARSGRHRAGHPGRRRVAGRARVLAGLHPVGLRTPCGAAGRGPRRTAARPGRTGRRPAGRRRGAGHRDAGPHGVPVRRPGQPAGRDGPRAVRAPPGVRRRAGRGAGALRPAPCAAGRDVGRRFHGPRRDGVHPAGVVRLRGGVVPVAGVVGCDAGLPGRAFDR